MQNMLNYLIDVIKIIAKTIIGIFLMLTFGTINTSAQSVPHLSHPSSMQSIFLRSFAGYRGAYQWKMNKASSTSNDGSIISLPAYQTNGWQKAIIPGTVLNSLVANKVYPEEPYYGDNNKRSRNLIPDIAEAGREFYHYWFRTDFHVPENFKGKRIWLKFHGINYRCDIWVNGKMIGKMTGMFNTQCFDITKLVNLKGKNALAVNVQPVDFSGSYSKGNPKRPGAMSENHNGGDGEIGKNVSMLMSVGWDFTAPDGIRDRNTGIWRDVELYATGNVVLGDPFVETKLPLPDTSVARETVSVDLKNASDIEQEGILIGKIKESVSEFRQAVKLAPHETRTISFTPEQYHSLIIPHPALWWPINKGNQTLYTLTLQFTGTNQKVSHTISTRFGIREITSDQQTPDSSRRFYVNGQPIFIRGTNWVPEAMLRNTEERTYAEMHYTKQTGMNLIRLWGGGITESDYFYQLCDEYGFLVWNEFWITGDTSFPVDTALYLKNFANTIKRIRNHASVAYYVASNESNEVPGTGRLVKALDPSHGYQVESECCGVHDGSPYKYENPMQYYENTASKRGSRIDGFNPEYGAPCLPTIETLNKLMPKGDLWPINDSVWNYMDGNGFHGMTTKYRQAVDEFGKSSSIEEFAKKAQFVGAMNFRAIWEVWNYNKFNYGDRFASGFLFWYHNSPLPQTASRLYDWYLQPTAALYYSQNGLKPLHPQFDYLKNTVSVYNDYRRPFDGYRLEAIVYDINSKPVWKKITTVNIPADGVINDAFKIDFPEDLSQVHFIKLKLIDNSGKLVSDAFYWRSKDVYKGAWTLTGPAVSGFATVNSLPKATLQLNAGKSTNQNKTFIRVRLRNLSQSLSFFTELKLLDQYDNSISPAYFTDNFFSLLPYEVRTVTIEIDNRYLHGKKIIKLQADAFNSATVTRAWTLKAVNK